MVKTMPNGKWPNLSGGGGAVPAFLSRALPGCRVVLSMVLCILALCSSLSRPLFCFKPWGSPALPYWDGLLDSNTQVREFGEINTQKSRNCSISPLNAVPREGVLSLPQHRPHFHEELPGKMFSRKLNHKTLVHKTPLLWDTSQKAVCSHHC